MAPSSEFSILNFKKVLHERIIPTPTGASTYAAYLLMLESRSHDQKQTDTLQLYWGYDAKPTALAKHPLALSPVQKPMCFDLQL